VSKTRVQQAKALRDGEMLDLDMPDSDMFEPRRLDLQRQWKHRIGRSDMAIPVVTRLGRGKRDRDGAGATPGVQAPALTGR